MSEPLDVEIDSERCMGSGNCLFWAPDTFDLSDDGYAVVLNAAATDEARLRIAAEGCPVGAISLSRGGVAIVLGETVVAETVVAETVVAETVRAETEG
jgi:ferredoxin